jgi:hypothetical protein
MRYLLIIILLVSIIAVDKSEKELKIEACVKLSKARLSKDSVSTFLQ